MTPFLVNAIACLFPLVASLHLGYDSADLDLPQIRRKLMIEGKRVAWVHISTWRMLLQDFIFGASQRL